MHRLAVCLAAAALVSACSGGNAPASSAQSGAASAASGTPAAGDAAAAAKPAAEAREITLPIGTHLQIVLETAVGSDISKVEEPVHAHLARAISVQGATVVPEGSRLSGVVTEVERSGRVKGRAHLAFRFDTLVPAGEDERYRIDTRPVDRTAAATKKKDALEIGGGAAGGALIGALIGGKKGALVGTAAGGGAGTALVLSTRGEEIRLPRGASITLQLAKPVTIRVKS